MSIESHDLRVLEDMEAMKPQLGDTVILKNGEVGKITEFDNTGRPYHITFRSGAKQWVWLRDIGETL